MKQNKHNQAIPESTMQEVQNQLANIAGLLKPYVIALTPAERQTLPKMGEKTLSFVEKARDFAVQNPSLRPPYLDMEAFEIDFADAHGLWTVQNTARQIDSLIDDTAMTAGSEAYQAALMFYGAAKVAAAQNIPGAKAVYEELRKRFPQGRRPAADTPEVAGGEEAAK